MEVASEGGSAKQPTWAYAGLSLGVSPSRPPHPLDQEESRAGAGIPPRTPASRHRRHGSHLPPVVALDPERQSIPRSCSAPPEFFEEFAKELRIPKLSRDNENDAAAAAVASAAAVFASSPRSPSPMPASAAIGFERFQRPPKSNTGPKMSDYINGADVGSQRAPSPLMQCELDMTPPRRVASASPPPVCPSRITSRSSTPGRQATAGAIGDRVPTRSFSSSELGAVGKKADAVWPQSVLERIQEDFPRTPSPVHASLKPNRVGSSASTAPKASRPMAGRDRLPPIPIPGLPLEFTNVSGTARSRLRERGHPLVKSTDDIPTVPHMSPPKQHRRSNSISWSADLPVTFESLKKPTPRPAVPSFLQSTSATVRPSGSTAPLSSVVGPLPARSSAPSSNLPPPHPVSSPRSVSPSPSSSALSLTQASSPCSSLRGASAGGAASALPSSAAMAGVQQTSGSHEFVSGKQAGGERVQGTANGTHLSLAAQRDPSLSDPGVSYGYDGVDAFGYPGDVGMQGMSSPQHFRNDMMSPTYSAAMGGFPGQFASGGYVGNTAGNGSMGPINGDLANSLGAMGLNVNNMNGANDFSGFSSVPDLTGAGPMGSMSNMVNFNGMTLSPADLKVLHMAAFVNAQQQVYAAQLSQGMLGANGVNVHLMNGMNPNLMASNGYHAFGMNSMNQFKRGGMGMNDATGNRMWDARDPAAPHGYHNGMATHRRRPYGDPYRGGGSGMIGNRGYDMGGGGGMGMRGRGGRGRRGNPRYYDHNGPGVMSGRTMGNASCMNGGGGNDGGQGRSALLEDFRATSVSVGRAITVDMGMGGVYGKLDGGYTREWQLDEIKNNIVEFASDQHGSRFIQQKLETATPVQIDYVLRQTLTSAQRLMTDVFGNYVVQKLLDHGGEKAWDAFASELQGRMLSMSLHMYGCRVVQKILEVVKKGLRSALVNELDGYVLKCIRDQNGNHVIQKCVELVEPEGMQFIVDAVVGQAVTLAEHSYGCRVVQRILEHGSGAQKKPIMKEIMDAIPKLIRDQYGNYVIQHVVEHGTEAERAVVINLVRSEVVGLSQHKFASNVVERCLEHLPEDQRERLIEILIVGDGPPHPSPLNQLVRDQYGNYVVQRLLDVARPTQRGRIADILKMQVGAIKKYSYGKHIIARLDPSWTDSQNNFSNDGHPSVSGRGGFAGLHGSGGFGNMKGDFRLNMGRGFHGMTRMGVMGGTGLAKMGRAQFGSRF